MGILNVTPDSFSDGGRYLSPAAATRRACEMVTEGAWIVDIGAESTRPGAADVPPETQRERALPVIRALRESRPQALISIDTRSAEVAAAALDAGACLINDVSALRDDPRMIEVAAASGAGIVLVHRRGDARTMQAGGGPRYADVVREVTEFLLARADEVQRRGISRQRLILDPGIGFGKRFEDNLRLLHAVRSLVDTGYPVLLGASRKTFLGRLLQPLRPDAVGDPGVRLPGSLAVAAWAWQHGVALLRVHDVRETVDLLSALRAIHDPP